MINTNKKKKKDLREKNEIGNIPKCHCNRDFKCTLLFFATSGGFRNLNMDRFEEQDSGSSWPRVEVVNFNNAIM